MPSITGVYLDRVGAYLVEAAVMAGLGFRAGAQHLGGWTTLGLAAGLFVVLIKAESDLVDVARVRSGAEKADDASVEPAQPGARCRAPRGAGAEGAPGPARWRSRSCWSSRRWSTR
ncbi:hypothetical protein GCM10025868_36510 [Angustibacter aerolatus]|uniref:Uncharacterized protein n=1 Tax=Angustibacter aerolatus TaxID=1162965 RepID=A0ABQ6JP06_9ACTN|nr:hypothetical protein [Angustibacter aerolatus]GMA88401.1 hypothetical protein GCM10025868_36510 [Angustibacter aerolatus]